MERDFVEHIGKYVDLKIENRYQKYNIVGGYYINGVYEANPEKGIVLIYVKHKEKNTSKIIFEDNIDKIYHDKLETENPLMGYDVSQRQSYLKESTKLLKILINNMIEDKKYKEIDNDEFIKFISQELVKRELNIHDKLIKELEV